jgi:hypothetical protein
MNVVELYPTSHAEEKVAGFYTCKNGSARVMLAGVMQGGHTPNMNRIKFDELGGLAAEEPSRVYGKSLSENLNIFRRKPFFPRLNVLKVLFTHIQSQSKHSPSKTANLPEILQTLANFLVVNIALHNDPFLHSREHYVGSVHVHVLGETHQKLI